LPIQTRLCLAHPNAIGRGVWMGKTQRFGRIVNGSQASWSGSYHTWGQIHNTVWRPLNDVVRNTPLLFCDRRTVRNQDLTTVPYRSRHRATYRYGNERPDEPPAVLCARGGPQAADGG
jgi:hypothetical protein